ncbi:integrase domain-containing protein [Undibacterium terreum]|uniref:Uncharacterized protein n=1 Tax=Undibacterium terreum TaxID=1224302 RepID=A0A916UTL3_9BURK|nr:integrase domain-containing protein [Undibacterium terreum]GGC87820.1 hypothetical protein GCM10011396_38810 [Undibacterium terreum]
MNKQLTTSLGTVFKEHTHVRMNGRVASARTVNARMESISGSFSSLEKLGYRLQDATNLTEKHIRALVQYWLVDKKLRAKTIEGHISNLRIFATWIGKPTMVKGKYEYASQEQRPLMKVNAAAKESKSLTGNNINIDEILKKADSYDHRFGLMLRMELAFGLRREEVLKCKPHHQDFEQYFAIFHGHGKGGRERHIVKMISSQQEILELVKANIGKNEAMGWPTTRSGQRATLKENLSRYQNTMTKLGITKAKLGVSGHSLRAQFAENNAPVHGIIPPSIGGTKGQMPKADMKVRLARLSEAMGHHRIEVMSAYYCTFGTNATLDRAGRCMTNIDMATAILKSQDLEPLVDNYRADCTSIRSILDVLEVEITLKEIQYLWKIYSERNGVAWVRPEKEIGICIEAAALQVIRQTKGAQTYLPE